MYFWNIAAVKQQLATGPLPPRAALKYVLAFVVTISLVVEVGIRFAVPATAMDNVATIANLIILVFGTLLVYAANGGDAGADFLGRYVALSWVLGVRVTAAMVGLMLAALTYFAATGREAADGQDPFATVSAVIAVLTNGVLYWRLSVHIRQVAFAASATDPST